MAVRALAKEGYLEAQPYPLPKRLPGLVYLDLNECPFSPPEHVVKAACRAAVRGNRYPSEEDYMEVKRLLAEYTGLDPENIVLTAGGDEGLRAVFDVFVGNGDRVVLLEPGFAMMRFYTVVRGGFYQHVRLREAGSRFVLDEDEVIEASSGARLVVIENPHNPTGSLVADEELVSRLIDETEAVILVDEAYFEFSGVTVSRLLEKSDRLLVLRTLSKAFCLAGFRVGYLLAQPPAAELVRKALTPFNLSIVQLAAAKAALEDRRYVEDVIDHVNSEKERIGAKLREMGVKVYESYTNFLLLKTGVSNIHQKLAEHGIVVKQVASLGPDYIRVTIGTRDENDRFLEAMEAVLKGVGGNR